MKKERAKLGKPAKPSKGIVYALLGFASIVIVLGLLHAQTFLNGGQSPPPDSIVQITAEAQGLDLIPPDDQPRNGTFWYVMGSGVAVPFPCPPKDISMPVYGIVKGQFLVDATGGTVAYNPRRFRSQVVGDAMKLAVEAQANSVVDLITRVRTMAAAPATRLGMSSMSMMMSSLASSYAYGNSVYLSNLTATVASDASMTAHFSIGGGTNFVPYDILLTTNLLTPVAQWNWNGIGYTGHGYTFSNQPADLGFYMLAKPSKTMVVGLGNDSVTSCDVPYALTNALQVVGGYGQSLALKNDGTVVAWGTNFYGEGVVPSGLSGVTMIAAGWYHDVALLTNGTVTAWGISDSILLGGLPVTNVPPNLTNVMVISAQALHTLALRRDGTVVAWGYNADGETNVPVGLSNVVAISAGFEHSLAVSNGVVVAWGGNTYGQRNVPAGLSNVVDVAAGVYHSLALKKDGTVVAWGDNAYGETTVPSGLSNVVAIAAGGYPSGSAAYSMALKSDGTVVTWGYDEPTAPVGGLNNVIGIAAGAYHALALRTGPPTPVITLEPVDVYQVQGSNAVFTARGAGLYGVTYQWQTNGVNLPGATSATLTLTNVQPPAQLASYGVVVGNEVGSIVSSNANFYFVTPPVITSMTLPTNQVAIYLTNLVLNVAATAPGINNGFPISYQWQLNGTNIAGATAASYTIHANANTFGTYSVLVSNAAGSTNAAWQVTVYYPGGLAITQQPTNQYQIVGGSISFYGSGVGSNAVAYQWAFNGTNLAGATNASLTLTNVQAAQQGYYNFTISSAGNSLTSSNASFYLVQPPTIVSQSSPTNFVCIYGNVLSFNAAATAPYQTNGFPLHYQWQWNGTNITNANTTNYSFTVNDTNGGVYSLLASNAAGSTNVSWWVTVTNTINVTNDLLLIYNTNSADSTTVLNYYLANRPGVSGANVLGISFSGFYITNFVGNGDWVGVTNITDYETISPMDFTNQVLNPVQSWLAANSTKRPQYVVMMLDVPSRISYTATNANLFPFYTVPSLPSVSYQLATSIANWQPYITHLNMNGTNDCIGYINKLASIGTLISSNSPLLSASAGGYGNTNYAIDNIRSAQYSGVFAVSSTTNGLLAAGVSPRAITYVTGIEGSSPPAHLTGITNLTGYICWGGHSSLGNQYAINGSVKWLGNSGWWLIRTEESFNGQRYVNSFGNYIQWFSANAFGGTNYSNTPIGAVSYPDEPGAYATDNSIYFGLWASGKNLGICSWTSLSSGVHRFQVVGDPFVIK